MAEAPAEEKLLSRRDGAVAHIIFNNPARHNAVSLEMWQRMHMLLDELAADPGVRMLVVSGAGGKAFVSGADISKFESERASEEAVKLYNATSAGAYEKLYHFPKPTIAKIQGYCVGGGMNLAVCSDLRIANESAKFAIPAAKLGLGYGLPGVRRLSEIVGISRTMELFYTAKQLSAREAHSIGLVNEVVPDGEIDAAVERLTATIAGNAPLTIATIKACARELGKPESQRDLAKLDRMVQACFESRDYTEGRRAFMEKRKPVFEGR
ncbi:MAG TPA: enoyl-CoA hydratase [Hyphomicrobiaceae bacterium]|nr:enoyl-CoA hydratase [Hyphomicrobiaceae bacterium]